MSGRRQTGAWGILGGTFDPIHDGHLALAQTAREELDLDGVLFVPAGQPPHKPDREITASSHRAAMVAMAIADEPAFVLSTVELDRPGPSYAVDTAAALRDAPPAADASPDELTWIMSVEALQGLPTWREPNRFLDLVRVAAAPRQGGRIPARAWLAEHFPGQEDRIRILDGPELGHSATAIRRLVGEGRSIRYLVPAAVDTYIHDHALYPAQLWSTN
ncbi:MAG TPA: nicotinate-nucleotide adenylyltransferase [Candidatus Saccharimonadia bacterium]|nr:nicotinate-nucleotide adenylyltransferase [Candidatus Saccharimonadia bacterium]